MRAKAGKSSQLRRAAERLSELLARADFVPPYELYAEILGAQGSEREIEMEVVEQIYTERAQQLGLDAKRGQSKGRQTRLKDAARMLQRRVGLCEARPRGGRGELGYA